MGGSLLALAWISLAHLSSAFPSPGEARPSSTTGFGGATVSAPNIDGSGPAPFRSSSLDASNRGSPLSTPTQATLDKGGPGGSSSGSHENNTGGGGRGDGSGQGGSQLLPAPAPGPVRQPRRRKRRGRKARSLGACQANAQSAANARPPGSSTGVVCTQPQSRKTPLQKGVTPQEGPQVAVGSERPKWTQPGPCTLDRFSLSYPVVPPPSPAFSRSQREEDINEADAVHETSDDEEPPSTFRHQTQNNQLDAPQRKTSARNDPQPSFNIHQTHCKVESTSNAVRECPTFSCIVRFSTETYVYAYAYKASCFSGLREHDEPSGNNKSASRRIIVLLESGGVHRQLDGASLDIALWAINKALSDSQAPESSSSRSAADVFYTTVPEQDSSNAERLAARSGYAGAGAFSSCAEKNSPYALEGFCLPENLVSSNDSVGLALIRLAGTEIGDELRQARILIKAQAQLKQNCIDLLCTPKERLLINAEAALNVAYRTGGMHSSVRPTDEQLEPAEQRVFTQEELDKGYEKALAEHLERTCRPGTLLWLLSREGTRWCMNMVKQHSQAWKLTSSEVDYAYHRFYEFAADYNFAMAMHGFLYGVRPDPRKGLPGEDALASPSVLRILATVKGSRIVEMKKRSLLSFQLGHIKFMRQLLREKRLILANLFMPPPPIFSTSNSSNVCSERSGERRNRRVARVDKRTIQ